MTGHDIKRVLCLLVILSLANAGAMAGDAVIRDRTLPVFPLDEKGMRVENGPLPLSENTEDDLLEIWFGQVNVCDCIAVRCHGQTMLIDGGNRDNGGATRAFLQRLDFRRADYIYNTHHHDDHIEMQESLLRRGEFYADVFLTPYPKGYNADLQRRMEKTVDDRGIEYRQLFDNDVLYLGGENGAKFEFHRWTGSTDPNHSSLFAKVMYGRRSIWLIADVISKAQRALADERTDIDWKADVLKAGHHGYSRQDSRLLMLISPELTVITNSYPGGQETIRQMDSLGIARAVTGLGTIYLKTDGGSAWYWNQEH